MGRPDTSKPDRMYLMYSHPMYTKRELRKTLNDRQRIGYELLETFVIDPDFSARKLTDEQKRMITTWALESMPAENRPKKTWFLPLP